MLLGGFLLLGLLQAGAPLDRVRTLIAEGKLAEASTTLASLDKSSPDVAYLSGVVQFNLRNYGRAAADLEAALSAMSEKSVAWPEAVQMLARSYYLSGRHRDALPWLGTARKTGINTQEVLFMLGNAHLRTQAPEQARGAFAELFGVAPASAGAHLLTAQMMVRSQLEDAAEKELARALELDPKLPGAHFLSGEIAIFRGELDRGIEELKREIAVNPNFSGSYWRLGDAYVRQERYDEAVVALQQSIWLNQTFSAPFILLGKVYLKKEQLANAEGMLRRALQMDPQNSSAHYLLGTVLVRSGRPEEGKALLKRSVSLKGEDR